MRKEGFTSSRFKILYNLDESKTEYRRFEIQMYRSYKGLERMDKMPLIPDMEEDARL